MPIFDQGYQHWTGHLASQLWRWWAITRQGLRAQFKSKMTRWWVIVCFAPALTLVGVMIIWSLFEQGNQSIQFLLQFLPQQFRDIPREYRLMVWTLAYHFFFMVQIFMLMILVLLIGPGLISNDMRVNALPLYLSRPVRRTEYFLGKLGVIATFVLLVTAAPATLAWVLGVLFSLSWSAVVEVFPILIATWLISLILAVIFGLWMLALSSLSRSSRYVAMMWFGFWLVTNMLSGTLFGVMRGEEWPLIISFTRNVHRVGEELLGTEAAWAKVDEVVRTSRAMMKQQAGRLPIPGINPGMRHTNPPSQPEGSGRVGLPRMTRFDRTTNQYVSTEVSSPWRSLFPWTWSAGVLAGIGVISLCILSFRVRSLDRLR